MTSAPCFGMRIDGMRVRCRVNHRGALLAIASLLIAGCWGGAAPSPDVIESPVKRAVTARPAPPESGYVGSERCAECHAEVSALYRSHPMAQSTVSMPTPHVVEDEHRAEFTRLHYRYSVDSDGDEVRHHEELLGADHNPVYHQSERIAYAVGSGQRGRSYLVDRDGLLFESPITWYSTSSRWDLSPGYGKHNQHFDRQIGDACLHCHVGTIRNLNDEPDRYATPMFLEGGIGCERCHGPGAKHVDLHRRKNGSSALTDTSELADTIVNPSRLDAERREAVCNQCHLQGDDRVLRYGRKEGDFRPGDALHDVWISFTRGTRIAAGNQTAAVSQVEQMHASRCFQESGGRMGCVSCHNPHRNPAEEERATFYRTKCLACHLEPDSTCSAAAQLRDDVSDSCITCHMPQLQASNVPHTSQTDHRVLRDRNRPSESTAEQGTSLRIFGSAEAVVPQWELQRARGLLMTEFAVRDRDRPLAAQAVNLLAPLTEQINDDAVLWTKLGVAYDLANVPDRARQAWERAVLVDDRLFEPWQRLALHLFDDHSPATAWETLEQAYQRNPWDQAVCGRLILARAASGREQAAFELAKQASTRFPGSVQLHRWLATAYARRQNHFEAERHQRQADLIDASDRPSR